MSTIRIKRSSLDDVETDLDNYRKLLDELERKGTLKESTRKTFWLHAENFVWWLRGEFDPGERNR